MIHVWKWQFIPATYFLLIGFLFMGAAVFARITSHFPKSLALALFVPTALASLVIYPRLVQATRAVRAGWSSLCSDYPWRIKFRFLFGPWLGSED